MGNTFVVEDGSFTVQAYTIKSRKTVVEHIRAQVGTPVKRLLALAWLAGVGAVVLYLLLRPSPSASGVPFLPDGVVVWLNRYHDLRTLPMAWGYAGVTAIILWNDDRTRHWCLGAAFLVLIGGETAQLWIPTRFFTWPDIGYSVLGVVFAEGCAGLISACCRKFRSNDALKEPTANE